MINDCGSELNAVILQIILSLAYGAVWGGASVIWEKDNWSILKETIVHLVICSLATFPIAYFSRWMSYDIKEIIMTFEQPARVLLCHIYIASET